MRRPFSIYGNAKMSQLASNFGNAFGLGQAAETFEQAITWGPLPFVISVPAYIYSGATDPTNTPTTNLRPGLLMGIRDADGQWSNYNPAATDGTEVAVGVLPVGLTMIDFLTNNGQNKVYGIIVGGKLQGAKIIGLDGMARAQLAARFIFDDNIPGSPWFTYEDMQTKVANYSVLGTDNFTVFDNLGAIAPVTFTLPPIANGYQFNFRGRANSNLIVASAEGANMEALNNLTANSVAFQTGGQIIGGEFQIVSNIAGTKWLVRTLSAGSNTVTVA